jgi:predicted nuclease of restriction endonuclease-like (RecB) superfamily
MKDFSKILYEYLRQAQTDNLKVSSYPKEYSDLKVRVSFGMGAPARIPWIAFMVDNMQVSNGFYPVYLYYKEEQTLILSYGISETNEFSTSWPSETIGMAQTISDYFNKKVPRYGDSYVYKAYNVSTSNDKIKIYNDLGQEVSSQELNNDLESILERYKQCFDMIEHKEVTSEVGIGLFYMEKQLEDFLIQNWDHTELGKRFDLIIEDGELKSQQYRTDIGSIDILAKDKKKGNYVVIELKKNQTSDDTLGQLARYMGWVKEKLGDNNVKGIIIAGAFDKRSDYAVKIIPGIEIYTYKVDFELSC